MAKILAVKSTWYLTGALLWKADFLRELGFKTLLSLKMKSFFERPALPFEKVIENRIFRHFYLSTMIYCFQVELLENANQHKLNVKRVPFKSNCMKLKLTYYIILFFQNLNK